LNRFKGNTGIKVMGNRSSGRAKNCRVEGCMYFSINATAESVFMKRFALLISGQSPPQSSRFWDATGR
jgi:hypothetical protein